MILLLKSLEDGGRGWVSLSKGTLYFEKKRKGFGSYKKSVVAVINKLIRVIYAMLTRKEKFDPSKVAPSCYIKVKSSMEVNFDHAA